MRIKIKRLTLRYFKGIDHHVFEFGEGQDASIFANNALGKTTGIPDAVNWLLFGKDSQGKTDFEIKTTGVIDGDKITYIPLSEREGARKNGAVFAVIPNIDHEVEGVLDVGGQEVTLKKIYRELYGKVRGIKSKTPTGHTTDYFIDGVEVKTLREYQQFIAGIASEERFRLLANPTHFNEKMDWQERRKVLLDFCENITDSSVLAAFPELNELQGVMAKRSLENEKTVLKADQKVINEGKKNGGSDIEDIGLDGIGARIQEAERSLPAAVGFTAESLMFKAQKATAELQELQEEKSVIENGGQVALKRKELAEIETAIINLKNKHAATSSEAAKGDREELTKLQNGLFKTDSLINGEMQAVSDLNASLERLTGENKSIVSRWKEAKEREKISRSKVFVPGGPCQTCGRDCTCNDAKEKEEIAFNLAKSTEVEAIVDEIKRITVEGDKNASEINATKESVDLHTKALATVMAEKATVEGEIAELQKSVASKEQAPDVTELPEYKELEFQLSVCNEFLLSVDSTQKPDTTIINAKITAKQTEITETNQQITSIEMRSNGEKRIRELKEREQELAKKFEQNARMLNLIEDFEHHKCEMLEAEVNGKFELVKWKLFDEQNNGERRMICVCMIDGVTYPNFNYASQRQAGMAIIKTLSSHYDFHPCVFVDNSESITSLPDMDCQVIRLVVSKIDAYIRVELQ